MKSFLKNIISTIIGIVSSIILLVIVCIGVIAIMSSKKEIQINENSILKIDLEKTSVLLNGTQALVRLMLMQKTRDMAAGLNTAGYVSGYRGSPLGAVDMQMVRAQAALNASNVRFDPGLNEDLAATALWGTQQAELRGEGKYQGVFGLWYGKGPGVDRSGDVMRHANMAGTSCHGGVVMAMGDDHTGESGGFGDLVEFRREVRFVENLIVLGRPGNAFFARGVVEVDVRIDHVLHLRKRAFVSQRERSEED